MLSIRFRCLDPDRRLRIRWMKISGRLIDVQRGCDVESNKVATLWPLPFRAFIKAPPSLHWTFLQILTCWNFSEECPDNNSVVQLTGKMLIAFDYSNEKTNWWKEVSFKNYYLSEVIDLDCVGPSVSLTIFKPLFMDWWDDFDRIYCFFSNVIYFKLYSNSFCLLAISRTNSFNSSAISFAALLFSFSVWIIFV